MISFRIEWQENPNTAQSELDATQALFEMRNGAAYITGVLDHHSCAARTGIYRPMSSVAEFIARNGWFLLNESPNPQRLGTQAYLRRHNWQCIADGFAMPNIEMENIGGQVRVKWSKSALYPKLQFLEEGCDYFQRETVEQTLWNEILSPTLDRLSSQRSLFADNIAAIEVNSRLDAEEKEYARLAAIAGMDGLSIDDGNAQTLQMLFDLFQNVDELEQVLATGTPESLAEVPHFVDQRVSQILLSSPNLPDDPWIGGRKAPPWKVGYAKAQKLRSSLDLTNNAVDLEKVSSALGLNSPEASESALEGIGERLGWDAFAISNHGKIGIDVLKRAPRSIRFACCRALFEILKGVSQARTVGSAETWTEKANRAFAAEFLAPSRAISERIAGNRLSASRVADLAEEFDVSELVIKHQIKNHNLVDNETYARVIE